MATLKSVEVMNNKVIVSGIATDRNYSQKCITKFNNF